MRFKSFAHLTMPANSRKLLTMIALSLFVCLSFGQNWQYAENEVLVKFKPGNELAATATLKGMGAHVIRKLDGIGVVQVRLAANQKPIAVIQSLKALRFVDYAEPNYKKQLFFVPNDPEYAGQWGPKKVRAEQAWEITMGDPSVVVAIIDTGVMLSHVDLAGKLVPGYDFSDNDNDPSDSNGHGTHCSGISAAATNNGTGVAGIGFNCRVMPLKIFNNATDAVSAAAIMHAADNGVKVISMSYGSGGASATEQAAVNYAWNKGVTLFAAAGNGNSNQKLYPAAFDNCIAVGSTDPDDSRSGFSQYGDWVDVAAPGSNYRSTYLGGGYSNQSGTSMACPCAAGVAALVWSNAPAETTNVEIRDAIESSCDNVGNWLAHGRVNAEKALESSVIAPPVEEGAIDVSVLVGASFSGIVENVHSTDGIAFKVKSVLSEPLGQIGSAAATFQMNQAATGFRSFTVKVKLAGPKEATGMVYLYNYLTESYDFIKAIALSPSGTLATLPIRKDFTPYVSPINKQARVAVRGLAPYRRVTVGPRPSPVQFDLQADLVQIIVRNK